MKLCLVNIVLMLLMTSYKGMVDGEEVKRSPGSLERDHATESLIECYNTYPVSHNRTSPNWNFTSGYLSHKYAPHNKCWDYCNKDVTCQSVRYTEYGCRKYNISVQELKDTGGSWETVANTTKHPIYITYDRHCAECYNTYPVSHNRASPNWNFTSGFLSHKYAPHNKCWDYCNKDVNCRSVRYTEYGCRKYNISVQELKDTRGSWETVTNTTAHPIYITYDRRCKPFSSH